MRNSSPGIVDPKAHLIHPGLKTPRAAAIAGILFSVLLICSLWLFWQSVPVAPHETGSWLKASSERVSLALNLIPFAGVAFLWFLGVLRDRLGEQEDQFFATVFLGSGLLFLGAIFVAASIMGDSFMPIRLRLARCWALLRFLSAGRLRLTSCTSTRLRWPRFLWSRRLRSV